jgi:hypothetical protein
MARSREHMRGVGAITVIVILLFVVLVGNFLLTMGSVYMQYWTVRDIMTDVATTPGASKRSPQQIWNDIDRRLSINSVYDNVARENFSFEEVADSRFLILEYEVRKPYFGNLDLVASFGRRHVLAP